LRRKPIEGSLVESEKVRLLPDARSTVAGLQVLGEIDAVSGLQVCHLPLHFFGQRRHQFGMESNRIAVQGFERVDQQEPISQSRPVRAGNETVVGAQEPNGIQAEGFIRSDHGVRVESDAEGLAEVPDGAAFEQGGAYKGTHDQAPCAENLCQGRELP
jgi:hypothetical protein